METLRNAVRAERVSHAILFVGPRGTGKTSLARILAKAVNCTDLRDGDACDACVSCVSIREGTTLDVVEIDAASNRGIDDVRGLRERLVYPPGQLRRKIYILDEAHQITPPAWNALLKSLEEPPDFVIFMFASTEPAAFPPAILSRLQRYDVRRLGVSEIEGKLTRILQADGREAEPAAIQLIARLAAGGMRDAESMLDQLLSAAPERIEEHHVRDLLGLADADAVDAFIGHLVRSDGAAGVALLDGLEERGRDIRALLDQAVDAIRSALIAGMADPAAARYDVAALAAAGRRLAAIDPNRAGIGGLRFQLELAMFATEPRTAQGEAPVRPIGAPKPSATRAASTPSPAPADGPSAPARPAARVEAALPERDPAGPARRESATIQSPAVASAPPGPAQAAPGPAATAPAATPGPAAGTAPVEADAGSTSNPDLAALLAAWPAIVEQLSAHPPTRPLIVNCRPVAVDGAIVTLGFPEEQPFLKDQAERRRPGIEAGIAAVIGHPVTVRCVVANVEIAPLASEDLVAEARRIFGDDLADIAEVH
ncbi:MAG: polymerase subunit gamma/tau [Chloroflexota bacterium]|nr:polymerase subunit gamma/tau [Chloroflexota bacterium]